IVAGLYASASIAETGRHLSPSSNKIQHPSTNQEATEEALPVATVSGMILSQGSLAPLANISVSLTDTSGTILQSVCSDITGLYTFSDLTDGSFLVSANDPLSTNVQCPY